MIRLCILAAMAAPAHAGDDRYDWPSGSYVVIRPCDCAPAVAEVEFKNLPEHGDEDFAFELRTPGIDATASARMGRGGAPDEIHIDAPGFVAVPPTLVVPEGGTATALLYPIEGLGL
jgi:hypothetical protein